MRTSISLVGFALLSATALAQTNVRPKGFLNLPWGASRSETLAVLKKNGVAVPEEDPGGDKLVGEGGSFAGQEAVSWSLEFAGGRLFSGAVTLKPVESGAALYRELKQQLIGKYGPHSAERKLGGTPEERRARALSGITTGRRGMAATWKFGPNLQDKDTVSLTCELAPPEGSETEDDSLTLVTLRYTNETMKTQAAAVAATAHEAVPAKASRPVKGDCL